MNFKTIGIICAIAIVLGGLYFLTDDNQPIANNIESMAKRENLVQKNMMVTEPKLDQGNQPGSVEVKQISNVEKRLTPSKEIENKPASGKVKLHNIYIDLSDFDLVYPKLLEEQNFKRAGRLLLEKGYKDFALTKGKIALKNRHDYFKKEVAKYPDLLDDIELSEDLVILSSDLGGYEMAKHYFDELESRHGNVLGNKIYCHEFHLEAAAKKDALMDNLKVMILKCLENESGTEYLQEFIAFVWKNVGLEQARIEYKELKEKFPKLPDMAILFDQKYEGKPAPF